MGPAWVWRGSARTLPASRVRPHCAQPHCAWPLGAPAGSAMWWHSAPAQVAWPSSPLGAGTEPREGDRGGCRGPEEPRQPTGHPPRCLQSLPVLLLNPAPRAPPKLCSERRGSTQFRLLRGPAWSAGQGGLQTGRDAVIQSCLRATGDEGRGALCLPLQTWVLVRALPLGAAGSLAAGRAGTAAARGAAGSGAPRGPGQHGQGREP